jgi:ankyrin repeat protein
MDDVNHELKLAIDNENVSEILKLVNQGGDPNIESYILGYSAFEAICFFSGDLEDIKFLIEKGADYNGKNKENFSGLHCACINLNLEMVKYFIDLGVDVNSEYIDGDIAITYAWQQYKDTKEDPSSILMLLISNGSNITDDNGELLYWINDSVKGGFSIVEYYNKHSTNSENIKPVKR